MNSSTFLFFLVEVNVFVSLMEHCLKVLLFSLSPSHTLSVWLLYLKAALLNAGWKTSGREHLYQWKQGSCAYMNSCFRFDSCDSLGSVNKISKLKPWLNFFSISGKSISSFQMLFWCLRLIVLKISEPMCFQFIIVFFIPVSCHTKTIMKFSHTVHSWSFIV